MYPSSLDKFKIWISNWIKDYLKTLSSVTRITLQSQIDKAIDVYAKEHGDPFSMKIDVLDLIIDTLKDHEKELDRQVNTLKILSFKSGEMVRSRGIGDYIRVGTQNRVVLKEFEVGQHILKRSLIRPDGSFGGVELLIN